MALDFATRRVMKQMAKMGAKPLHEYSVEEVRALAPATGDGPIPTPPMGRVEEHAVPVNGGEIVVRVLVPRQKVRGVIVYFHGGGWVMCNLDQFDAMARKLAERTSCAVVLVDYRLAPENRYPVAVDDCYAALEWVDAHLVNIASIDDVPVIVAGDSSGGNLSATMALRARDREGPKIALQVLIYPVVDCDLGRSSYLDPENQQILTRDTMAWFWDHYLPDVALRSEPDVSPLRSESLEGLPPAVILTAEHDVLRDEGEAYAARLREAGVPVDFQRHIGQMHGFFTMLPLPGSERGFQQVVKAVQRCIFHHQASRPSAICQ
jgi:acetyl esterase